MPQKLIRLTSTSGDGVFNDLFNEEIIIPENSEIALQSLTLERRSQSFTLNNLNNIIKFQAVGDPAAAIPTNTGNVEPIGNYSNQNDVSILNQITNCLNRNSSMLTDPEAMNIQWNVESIGAGNVQISAKPSPFYPITATADQGESFYVDLAAGNDWTEEDDTGKDTDATFHITNKGTARYRKSNIQGDPDSYWYNVEDSPTAWRIYDSIHTGPPTGPFQSADIDASGNIVVAAPSTDVYTSQSTDPIPDIPYRPATPLSFIVNDAPVDVGVANAEPCEIGAFQIGEYGVYRDDDGTASGNINECYMYGNFPMIKSTGSFRVRLKRLINATGEDAAIMGIVKGSQGLEKLRNATIAEEDFEYAIKIRGNNQAIQYKTAGVVPFTDSTSTPINHIVANPNNKNDVIEICLDNGDFLGIVNQNNSVQSEGTPSGTDSAKLMPRQPFDVSENYYFVLCMLEDKDEIVLDNVAVSLDPYGSDLLGQSPRLIDTYLPTTDSDLLTLIEYQEKDDPNDTDFDNGRLDFAGAGDVNFAFDKNNSLANFLGFPTSILGNDSAPQGTLLVITDDDLVFNKSGVVRNPYVIQNGFTWTAPNIYALAGHPQNLIVETQSFTLDSYDSYGLLSSQRYAKSGGSRRNILATIPSQAVDIPGTANAILQFEPTTLNYIAIKNRGDITTRQLKFKVLTSNYGNVEVENMAALVLLIKSP